MFAGLFGIFRVSAVETQRRGRDSNPRYLSVHTLSKRARSTTLTPLLIWILDTGYWVLGNGTAELKNLRPELSISYHTKFSPQYSVLSPQSSVLSLQSSVLSPQSSVFSLQSSVLSPHNSVIQESPHFCRGRKSRLSIFASQTKIYCT